MLDQILQAVGSEIFSFNERFKKIDITATTTEVFVNQETLTELSKDSRVMAGRLTSYDDPARLPVNYGATEIDGVDVRLTLNNSLPTGQFKIHYVC